jgi:hypothetical protein
MRSAYPAATIWQFPCPLTELNERVMFAWKRQRRLPLR